MPISQEILIALFIIYFAECISIIRRNHVSISVNTFNRSAIFYAGLRIVHVVPLTRVYAFSTPIFYLTKTALYVPKSEDCKGLPYCTIGDYIGIRYSDILKIRISDNFLHINEIFRLNFQTPLARDHYYSLLLRLRKADPDTAKLLIEKDILHMTDTAVIAKIISNAERKMKILRLSSFSFVVLLMIVFPFWAIVNDIMYFTILPILILLLIAYLISIASFCICSKKIHHKIEITEIISLVLCPVGIAHSIADLTEPLLSNYDVVAASALLLKKEQLILFFRSQFNGLEVSLSGELPEDLEHRFEFLKERYLYILKEFGIGEKDFDLHKAGEGGNLAYCPLCFAEYAESANHCSDCGVPLKKSALPQSS